MFAGICGQSGSRSDSDIEGGAALGIEPARSLAGRHDAVRGGYFYEHVTKGDRKYLTFGLGLKYRVFGLDVSYLLSVKRQSPLANTLRFTMRFIFEKLKKNEAPVEG